MPNLFVKPACVFIAILLVACAVNLTVMSQMRKTTELSQLEADEREYYDLSSSVIQGHYEFNSRRVMGHVMILAAARLIVGDNLSALQVLITLMFSFSAPMAYLVTRRFSSKESIAAAAGLAVALWPPLVAYGITLYSETTALPVFLAFLAALPRGRRLGGDAVPAWRWILSGVMFGLCMLIRPMYLLFTPFVPVILWAEEDRLQAAVLHTALLAFGCAAAVLPWSVYASIKLGEPLLLSTNGGETLAGGLNPSLLRNGYVEQVLPNGRTTWTGPGKWLLDSKTGFLTEEELKLPHAQKSKLLRERMMQWIWANPSDALYLEAAKLAYMWGIYPFWNGAKQTLLGNVPTLLLLLTGVCALVRLRSEFRSLAMLWSLPVFVSLVAMTSWGSWRFRQPADFALLAVAAILIGGKGVAHNRRREGKGDSEGKGDTSNY